MTVASLGSPSSPSQPPRGVHPALVNGFACAGALACMGASAYAAVEIARQSSVGAALVVVPVVALAAATHFGGLAWRARRRADVAPSVR